MTEAAERYNHIGNRLGDIYTLARLLHPSVRIAVVYVGWNHAKSLIDMLLLHRFEVERSYGQESAAPGGAGCLGTAAARGT